MSVAIVIIVEFLEPPLRVVLMYAQKKKKGRFWGEADADYLSSGSNKMKVWRRWSRFLLLDCCGWVIILGSACV